MSKIRMCHTKKMLLLAGILFCLISLGDAMVCTNADGVEYNGPGLHSVDCGSNEQCFTEYVTTPTLQRVYNMGCRSNVVCNIMSTLPSKAERNAKRDFVNCAKCCTTTNGAHPCNVDLCGFNETSNSGKNTTHTLQDGQFYCGLLDSGSTPFNRSKLAVCSKDESCYTERVTRGDFSTVYNMGCRSNAVCKIMETLALGVGKRRAKRQLVDCARCCKTTDRRNPCNFDLCGMDSPMTCLSCDSVSSPSQCTTSRVCPSNQMCASRTTYTGSELKYHLYCEDKAFCKQLAAAHVNRRDAHGERICEACCVGDRCNSRHCFELGEMMYNNTVFG